MSPWLSVSLTHTYELSFLMTLYIDVYLRFPILAERIALQVQVGFTASLVFSFAVFQFYFYLYMCVDASRDQKHAVGALELE